MTNINPKEEFLPQAKTENIVIQEAKDELLIYNLQTHKTFCLNKTSAAVWQLCDGKKTIREISLILSIKLQIPPDVDFVWLALIALKKQDLLIQKEGVEKIFKGLSRREMVRKVGLSSIVALPVICSVVSPTAVNAQSGNLCSDPGRDSCTINSDCAGSLSGDTCQNNCCVFGTFIPGNGCIPSPTNPCPMTPGCDPLFGC